MAKRDDEIAAAAADSQRGGTGSRGATSLTPPAGDSAGPRLQGAGADDFWGAYGRHADEVNARVLKSVAARPGVLAGPAATAEATAEPWRCWTSAVQSARQGAWSLYEVWSQQHGERCAEVGLSLHDSTEIVRALSRHLLPALVSAFAAEPSRLAAAVQAMNDFSEHGARLIAEAYLVRKEVELHAREEDLATTLDSIGDAVVVTDAAGRVVRMNPVAQRLTGFAIHDCRGSALEDVLQIENEDTGAVVESPVPRVLREGTIVGLANHTVLIARDGTRRPIADSGAPVRDRDGKVRGVVLVFRDVTEERRAEEALRHWERVFQHATWGVALADVKEVRFRAVNPAYAAMHGYAVEELLGAPVSTLWTADTRADMERHAEETHEHGHLVTETTHRCKDGTTLPVEVVAATIKDSSGKIAWFVANVQDITERKRLQNSRARAVELEERNRRIEAANRMKSDFLANMSHELRTPLNSVIGFAELLHDEQVGAITTKQKEFLGDILAGGRHLLRLINDVLDLAKVEAGKMEFRPEVVNLERLVATVVQSLRATAMAKRLEVVVSVDASLPEVELDPARFKQVLYNYLSNALKFTPDGGKVDVRVTPEGGEWFRLEVEDSGEGIAPEQVPRLFVAFQQLESGDAKRHGGTGLGLALTRRLAEAQGGTVGVRPAKVRGCVFFAVLPRRYAGLVPSPDRHGHRAHVARLLLLEPEHHAREALVAALLDAGYEVESVTTALLAQRAWGERRYDAVLVALDAKVDELHSVVDLIHRDGGDDIPILGMGNLTQDSHLRLTQVLAKPVKASELLSALDRSGSPPPRGRPVLVVDDDERSLKLMEVTLSNLGYDAACFTDPHEALRALSRLRPAAVIIDVIMPDMNGMAFVQRLRAATENRTVPVMFWTVKDLSGDERQSLQSVADLVVQKGIGVGSRLSATLKSFLPAQGRGPETKP